MSYINKEQAMDSLKSNKTITVDIEEKCAYCNKEALWTILSMHIPTMLWLCENCHSKQSYDKDKDYIEYDWKKIYWWRMYYKIWEGFISEIDSYEW